MSEPIVGKPTPSRLARLLERSGGAPSDRLIVGPGVGLDAAVIDIGQGRVMAVAEDPIFPAPGLPLEMMGRFTVHIGASDVAVTGIRPEFMTYTLLLPGSAPEDDARRIITSVSEAAAELGITIAGGHTGWYDTVNVPIVGGVTVWGTGERWVSPGGARPGDVLLMTKGPAIEAAALLGVLYRERLEKALSSEALQRLAERIDQISVVEDALVAFDAGGVHAMHDATEGGVFGGLWEMATASGVSVQVDLTDVPVPEDIAGIARTLAFDPWMAISEGTLLAAADPARVEGIRAAWNRRGIESYVLGRCVDGPPGGSVRRDGRETPLPEPGEDPFWRLFFTGLTT